MANYSVHPLMNSSWFRKTVKETYTATACFAVTAPCLQLAYSLTKKPEIVMAYRTSPTNRVLEIEVSQESGDWIEGKANGK